MAVISVNALEEFSFIFEEFSFNPEINPWSFNPEDWQQRYNRYGRFLLDSGYCDGYILIKWLSDGYRLIKRLSDGYKLILYEVTVTKAKKCVW